MRGVLAMFISGFTVSAAAYAQSACQVSTLRCEYLVNPIGIDVPNPRFTWMLEDKREGAVQKGYQLIAGTDSVKVSQGAGDTWEQFLPGSSVQRAVYDGQLLEPYQKYFWTVRVTDKDGVTTGWAPVASFETGLQSVKNWKGAWISDQYSEKEKRAPYFRKPFTVTKTIQKATAYVAAAGLFELSINGKRIGDHFLDPMYTRFDRRILYVTHDVTAAVQSGENVIGMLLGNGWYNHQSTAVWDFHVASWRGRPAFCMDLRIAYTDGTVETISSGKSWKTNTGPLVFNSIYTAEHVDARINLAGWDKPGYVDTAWRGVIFRPAPASTISSQALQPVRLVEKIEPVSIKKFSDTNYVFDLGRNISGISRLSITGEAGTIIRLRHSERLYPDGHTDQSNIDVHYRPTDALDPFQTDIFILSGKGEEVFMPKFNYKGFQYVELTSSNPVSVARGQLTGYFVHSDVPAVGTVESSNNTLNRIWTAANNSYLSNLVGYPTDCPQREKNGWTGDAHIASETGLFNFDGITVYEKWLADHRDEQQPNGVFPSIIPTGGWGYEWGNGPDWTSTIAIIPWNVYLFYGDTTLLSDSYESMKRYVDYITSIAPTGITSWGLGDWIPVKSKTPVELTSTAYYYVDASIVSKAAGILGRTADRDQYAALASKIKEAFHKRFFNDSTGVYGRGVQTELSVPLQWGLVPDSLIPSIAAKLAARVAADSNHIDVGLLGTKAILNALSENGYADLAYVLASREDFPSWGWWIKNGATTLYENWPIDSKSDLSLNHIMFGEISAWYYKALGGIRPDPNNPGFRNILLEPHFVKGLDHFSASHVSPYGKIESSWKRSKKGMIYTVTVPPNSTARLKLAIPAGKKLLRNKEPVTVAQASYETQLPAGTFVFSWK